MQVEVTPTLAWNGPHTAGRNRGAFMDNIIPGLRLANEAVNGFTVLQRRLQRWWQHLPAEVRQPIWPRLLAALLILGLLLAFHEVVRGAVQQSELRHKATATQAAAIWRCRTLAARARARVACCNCIWRPTATQCCKPKTCKRRVNSNPAVGRLRIGATTRRAGFSYWRRAGHNTSRKPYWMLFIAHSPRIGISIT